MNLLQKLSVTSLAALLAACSPFVTSNEVDYKSAQLGNPLEVPPDLTRISNDGRYKIPGSASASAYNADQKAGKSQLPTAVNNVGDVQIRRDGNQRWLSITRAPQQLWDPVKSFWEENGFVISSEDAKTGFMETDWAENRAKIPLDPIRATLGKALDMLYSTGELDRFRTRMERNAAGGTDLFVSHRGMREVLTGRNKEQTTWEARPNDPALEDEMLRRLMVSLGVAKDRADAMIKQDKAAAKPAGAAPQSGVQLSGSTLLMPEGFDQAWRRVGLSLDRTGFTVEDRDRAAGVYYVRYVPPVSPDKQPKTGFISRLFSKAPDIKPVKYRVQVQAQNNSTAVRVLTESGQPADANDSARILKLLSEDLRQI